MLIQASHYRVPKITRPYTQDLSGVWLGRGSDKIVNLGDWTGAMMQKMLINTEKNKLFPTD